MAEPLQPKQQSLHEHPTPQQKPDARREPKQRPHWAVRLMESCPLEDVVNQVAHECPPEVDPYLAVGGFDPSNPGKLPWWFPHKWQEHHLSDDQILAWFEELLEHYSRWFGTWPLAGSLNEGQQQLVLSMVQMYHDLVSGRLPKPSFIPDEL